MTTKDAILWSIKLSGLNDKHSGNLLKLIVICMKTKGKNRTKQKKYKCANFYLMVPMQSKKTQVEHRRNKSINRLFELKAPRVREEKKI